MSPEGWLYGVGLGEHARTRSRSNAQIQYTESSAMSVLNHRSAIPSENP
jgi:hypothetical protein